MNTPKKPFLLLILDGFGYREDQKHNAIASANAPTWKKIWETYPHTLIEGSGHYVGLPDDQMGNSEVGHLNIGAGRVVYQELTRIDQAIKDKTFFENKIFSEELEKAKQRGANIHIMGLLSPGGVHSHEEHIQAMIDLANRYIKNIYLHAFLDGRDTPPQSALPSLQKIKNADIASITGRYYAMDRDKRWERTELAFNMLTQGKAEFQANTAQDALKNAYARNETDEFVKPTIIKNIPITKNDLIIFMNFRSDRARQLTQTFLKNGFDYFISLTQYADDIHTKIAYPPQSLQNVLSEYLSNLGLTQFHIAETEKYAHVTFFFNGGVEKPYPGEDRLLIASPKVATYDLQPEMSAPELTEKLCEAIVSQHYDFIVCNYANPDMVGHTGNFDAAKKAIEAVDNALEKIVAAIQKTGGQMIITADHGNAECMYDEKTQQPHTAHTSDPVPFVYIGKDAKIINSQGALSDIAPTILYLMGLQKPIEMTGNSLLELGRNHSA